MNHGTQAVAGVKGYLVKKLQPGEQENWEKAKFGRIET